MAAPIGRTFVEIDLDEKKYEKGIVDVKTTTKKKLSEIEKAWKGMGKKSEATIDQMKAKINKDYDTIKKHSLSTADDIVRAEKAKNAKIAKINKQQFGEQKSLLDKVKKHWMALSAAAVAAIYAIGRVLKESLQSFAVWETALVDMGKVTDESLESITDRIRELPPELGTATDLVKGYYQVISAGVTDPVDAINLLTEATQLSKAAHIEADEAIKGLTKVMAGYEGELETTAEAADLLFTIEKEGQTSVAELIPIIGGLAKISKDLGIESDTMGAALATVTLTAGTTSEAATRYEAVLIALMKPTTAMKTAIKEMGYESAQLAIKDIGLTEVLKKLKDSTEGSANKMAELFGRKEALVGISALASNSFETLTGKISAMAEKTGAADKAWEDYKTTLNAIWDTFKNTIGNMLIEVGQKLAPAIKDIVEKSSAWLQANQELITQDIGTIIEATATAVRGLATAYDILVTAKQSAIDEIDKLSEKQKETLKFILKEVTGYSKLETAGQAIAILWAKLTEKEEELGSQIARRTIIQDKGNETIDKTIKAVNKLKEAIVDEAAAAKATAGLIQDYLSAQELDQMEYNKQYLDFVKERSKAEKDAAKKAIEDNKKTTAAAEASASRRLRAYESMYRDLKGYGDDNLTVQVALIEQQRQKYIEMTGDILAADAWAAKEFKRLKREETLASDDFFAGMKVGLEDMAIAQDTWANAAYKIVKGFAENASAALSEFFFDAFTGELKDFEDYWDKFWDGLLKIISSVIADMVIKWAASQVKMAAASKAAAGASAASWTAAGATAGAASLGIVGAVAAAAYLMYRARTRPRGMSATERLRQQGFGDIELMGMAGISTGLISEYEALEKEKRWLAGFDQEKGMPFPEDYEDRFEAHRIAMIWWQADYNAALTRLEEANMALAYSSQTVQEALMTALMISDPAIDRWDSFTQYIKSSLYESIVGGITEALMESALFQRALLPITLAIEDAFKVAFDGTTFNAEAFFSTVDPLIAGLSTTLETLKPAFEAVSAVTTQLGGMLLPVTEPLLPETLHEGGIVGQTSTPTRAVSAFTFANAPRAHRGLMAGEIPVIAKRGEGIFTPAQMQALGRQRRGSSQPIHIHLNLDGREVGLAIVKDGDVVQEMDYQLTKMNRRVYA